MNRRSAIATGLFGFVLWTTACSREGACARVSPADGAPPAAEGRATLGERWPARGCLTFAGDLMLSRGVASRMDTQASAPWGTLRLAPDERWVANLEGVLGVDDEGRAGQSAKPAALCLGITPANLARLRGGPFAALSMANNHTDDFGADAHKATAAWLRKMAIAPILEGAPPTRVLVDGREWALVALNFINRDAAALQPALERARLSIGLARARTPLVAVLPHWGREYDTRVWPQEERAAALFRAWGAAIVAGAHTHVVGESRCASDAALYFGLGNLLFDQRAARQRRGLAVRCCPEDQRVECRTADVGVDEGSLALRWRAADGGAVDTPPWRSPCVVGRDTFTSNERSSWQRHPGAERFVFVQPFRALGPGAFFALHESHSTFDRTRALRPYVFRMEQAGHRDLWSGSALARPLVAARLIAGGQGELLCAIHRADTFLAPRPSTLERVRRVYRWTGFGFSGVQDAKAQARCAEL